jgi:dTDP-4-dehydrorhamnose 3,5-epimerase
MGRAIRYCCPGNQAAAVKFKETKISGVFAIELEPNADERGFFARLYCPEEFAAAGIDFTPVQTSLSRSTKRHTLRGMHYQDAPHAEAKLIHVTRGTIYEVVVDVRPGSPTYGQWVSLELSEREGRAVYIPEGCAHGFLTLAPDTDVLYQIGRLYEPGHAKGYRWNDPRLRIDWPAAPEIVSAADQAWPDFPARAKAG